MKVIRNKKLQDRERERLHRAAADRALRESRLRQGGDLREVILPASRGKGGGGTMGRAMRAAFKVAGETGGREALRHLLACVHEQSDLLEDNALVIPLGRLAAWSRAWMGDPRGWRPRTYNRGRQLSQLARFLLAKYRVPPFMDAAWMAPDARKIEQEWFIHIGSGQNIRKAEGLPFALTKMMAHHFLEAPEEMTIFQAMRWGQVMGMGGEAWLARAIVGSRLGREDGSAGGEGASAFWETVINWFVLHSEMLDGSRVGPIIDYIYNQRFDTIRAIGADGVLRESPPAQPNLTMRGRTIESMLAQTEAWHRKLSKVKDLRQIEWESCGIAGFDRVEGEPGHQRRWVIAELRSSALLKAEGAAMHHCVYSYAASCAARRAAIFSLLLDSGSGLERRLTIEVVPSRKEIVQARGRFNAESTVLDQRIVQAWAVRAGLSISGSAWRRWF